MPLKHAALKQIRKDRTRTLRNQAVRSELKTLKKRFLSVLAQQKREEALQLLPVVMRRFDQAVAKGIIHKNTVSRTKARLMRRLAPAQPAPPQLPGS
jgi:small subunit ribosomal protein S20